MFTARYALSLYITQIRFVFKGLKAKDVRERSTEDVFWSKWVKVAEEYRKFHNEDLHELYLSPNIIVKVNKSLYRPGKSLKDLEVCVS